MAQITIIRTSMRGAHLITDGNKVCWIQGRSLRPDMTLTRSGEEALAAATQLLTEYQQESEERERAKEERKQAFIEDQKKIILLKIRSTSLVGETDKALKIWSGNYQRMYGKLVKSYEYLPKSQVRIISRGSEVISIELPNWLYTRNNYIFASIVVEG